MTQTFILGKDAALEESISCFKTNLQAWGFEIVHNAELNPVPNVYSIHIKDQQAPMNFTNGKGSSSLSCLASAYGEYIERLSTNYFYADYYLGKANSYADFVHYPQEKWFSVDADERLVGFLPNSLLNEELFDLYVRNYLYSDGRLNLTPFFDIQSNNRHRGIVALPFIEHSSGETVYFPVSLITNLYVSNGISAGNTFQEAKVQALSEIFERGIKERILAKAYTLPKIPEQVINQYPRLALALQALNQEELRAVAYDCSLGGKYPVLAVVLFNQSNHTIYASFGAHPKFEVALERSITELLQGRGLDQLEVFNEPQTDIEQVADKTNIETHFIDSSGLLSWKMISNNPNFEFVHWNVAGDTHRELEFLLKLVEEDIKSEVYTMEYNHLGSCAVRVIVPNFSEIYSIDSFHHEANSLLMPYYNIIEQLVHGQLADVDDQEEIASEIIGYLQDNFDDAQRMRELLGFIPGKDSWWHNLRVAEFIALLEIEYLNNYEEAAVLIEWGCNLNESLHSKQQRIFWHCLKHFLGLLELDEAHSNLEQEISRVDQQYKQSMINLFGKQTVALVLKILTGEESAFIYFKAPENSFEKFAPHQQLLASYYKMNKAKRNTYTKI